MNELFYFTNTFPIGLSANWKQLEIEILSQSGKFRHIHVIPFIKEGEPIQKYIPPKNVIVHQPLLIQWPKFTIKKSIKCFLNKRMLLILKLLIQEKAFSSKEKFIKFLSAVNSSEALFNSKVYKDHLSRNYKHKTLYFFWGVNAAYSIPFLTQKYKNIVVRFHGYDLFLERNNGYIPLRKFQLKKATLALYVSRQGMNYQQSIYPKLNIKSEVIHLPVLTSESPSSYNKEAFNILTCSRIVNIKRLEKLIEALKIIKNKIIVWTHIGDGELNDYIRDKALKLPTNIQCCFTGWLSPNEIDDFYKKQPIDLFINISSTEGFPTSIVEAISHGVPILATDVGGTCEIVNESTGKLIPSDFSIELLKNEIISFLEQNDYSKNVLRRKALKYYKTEFSIEINTNQLINIV